MNDFMTADGSWQSAKETTDGKGGASMSARDWLGGLLWVLPVLAAFEWLTR